MEEKKEKKLFHRGDGEGEEGDERSGFLYWHHFLLNFIFLFTFFYIFFSASFHFDLSFNFFLTLSFFQLLLQEESKNKKRQGGGRPPKWKKKTWHKRKLDTKTDRAQGSNILVRFRDVRLSPEPVFTAHKTSLIPRTLTCCSFHKLLDISRGLAVPENF